MSDTPDPAQEAAEALIAAGHAVQPWGDELELWLVDGRTLSDPDLVALAVGLGLMDGPGRTQ